MSSPDLLRRVVLPVADVDDARRTCAVALPYIANANGEVIATYVIETNPGGVNKSSPEAMAEIADETLGIVEAESKEHDVPVKTEVRYGPTIAPSILDLARTTEATSVGFIARPGSRWVKLLSGDTAISLITQNDHPIVVFPRSEPPLIG